MESRFPKVIAVDFDGTLCENAWPGIGAPKEKVISYVRAEQAKGAILVLWTCRGPKALDEAVEWSRDHGIVFDYINETYPPIVEAYGSDPRKIYADEYIEDKAILPRSLEEGEV